MSMRDQRKPAPESTRSAIGEAARRLHPVSPRSTWTPPPSYVSMTGPPKNRGRRRRHPGIPFDVGGDLDLQSGDQHAADPSATSSSNISCKSRSASSATIFNTKPTPSPPAATGGTRLSGLEGYAAFFPAHPQHSGIARGAVGAAPGPETSTSTLREAPLGFKLPQLL